MSFKHKYTYEEKESILFEYKNGIRGFRELCRIHGIAQQSLKDWIRLYETFGMAGLRTGSTASHYPKEVKEAAVQDYLMHSCTVKEILKKYQIRSATQLKKWVKKYNGHEKLKASGTGGTVIMTKGRKTTFDELYERGELNQLTTIILVDSTPVSELSNAIKDIVTAIELPMPEYKDIEKIVRDIPVSDQYESTPGNKLGIQNDVCRNLQGLQFYEIDQVLRSALVRSNGRLTERTLQYVLEEKEMTFTTKCRSQALLIRRQWYSVR